MLETAMTVSPSTPPPAVPSHRVRLDYRVSYGDTDAMGVVYYANYLVFFERARSELMRAHGFAYREMETRGFALPVLEAHVEYKASAQYDDLLQVDAWVEWCRGVRMQVGCEVRREGKLLVSGYTVHACLDVRTRRPVRVLPELERMIPVCLRPK